jgi:TonB-dependent SusC/RagA subfamily outer membrane receptor
MTKYLLHINEPCSQNWDEMTAVQKGKFCNSCKKTVFDFTTATDNDIVKHIVAMKGEEFCGNFESGQLSRWIEQKNINPTSSIFYKYLLSLLLIGVGESAFAQDTTKVKQEVILHPQKKDSALSNNIENSEIPKETCSGIKINQKEKTILRGGVTSISTDTKPLFVLDGQIVNFSIIDKCDKAKIKSIDVLKNVAATALYGAQAFYGVIIIKTTYSKKELKKLLNEHRASLK